MAIDLFAGTGINFDPPEKLPKKVKEALKKLESKLTVEELKELNALKDRLIQPDGKLSPLFTQLAEKKARAVQAELEVFLRTLKQLEVERVVPELAVKAQAAARKLSSNRVREVYIANGFRVITDNPQEAMPAYPQNIKRIEEWMDAFHKAEDHRPNPPDRSGVTDLYTFVAYLDGTTGSGAVAYRKKLSGELRASLASYLEAHAFKQGERDRLGDLCIDIANAAKSYVFEKEEQRACYETYLLTQTPEMKKVFADIGNAEDEKKHQTGFFEPQIARIQNALKCDWQTARAVYNDKARTQIVKEKGRYRLQCGYCEQWSDFASVDEAKRQVCSCGNLFFRYCPLCGKQVQSVDRQCPHCDTQFLRKESFDKLLREGRDALKRSDVATAREKLRSARSGDPGRKKELDCYSQELERQALIIAETQFKAKLAEAKQFLENGDLDAAVKALDVAEQFMPKKNETLDLRKMIQEHKTHYAVAFITINELLKANRFCAAKEYIQKIKPKFPSLNLKKKEQEIDSMLLRCRQEYAAPAKNDEERAVACLRILDLCADFEPAQLFLKGVPLRTPRSLSAEPHKDLTQIRLFWSKTTQKGVKYRLVRSLANGGGETELVKETEENQYCDDSIQPGTTYKYSVYAVRRGAVSPPKSVQARALPRVSALKAEQKKVELLLSWNEPANSLGAEIRRSIRGKEELISACAHSPFKDSELAYDVEYIYSVTALYPGNCRSDVRTTDIRITPDIGQFNLIFTQKGTNSVLVSWNIPYSNVPVLIVDKSRVGSKEPGKPEERYLQLAKAVSQEGSCTLTLPFSKVYQITALAFSAGRWIYARNSFLMNTYEPFQLQSITAEETTDTTSSKETVTFVINGSLPRDPALQNLRVFIKTKVNESDPIPWVNSDFDSDEDCTVFHIAGNQDKADNGSYSLPMEGSGASAGSGVYALESGSWTIVLPQGQEEVYFVTAVLQYGKGKYSAPVKRRVQCSKEVVVVWKLKKHLFRGPTFEMHLSARRPINSHPGFVLCASRDDKAVTKFDAPNAIVVATLPENTFDACKYKSLEIRLEKNADLKGKKLYLFKKDVPKHEHYVLCWNSGFKGVYP